LSEPTFSQRAGIKPIKKPFQLRSMDYNLKTGLWNAVLKYYLYKSCYLSDEPELNQLFKKVYADLFNEPVDEMPEVFHLMRDEIKADIYERLTWNEVYDLIEFLPNNCDDSNSYFDINKLFIKYCNNVLTRENAGYRFVEK